MAERNFNLENIPVDEALKKYLTALQGLLKPGVENIPAEESLDRITFEEVYARFSSPHYNAAAMDGIAVRAAITVDAGETNPIVLKEGKDFIHVNTGDPVCEPHDAVIMAEDVIYLHEEQSVRIKESASVMQYVRPAGENFSAGQMLLPGNHKIRPVDIGILFCGGIRDVNVYKKPRVAVFPTGSEIIDASQLKDGEIPQEGKIIESNTRMYEAQIKHAGGDVVRFAPVPDDYQLLKEAVVKAAKEFDMVLVNAGSSAGTEDYTVKALRDTGDVIVHGVAMKPGKPVILAIVNNKPVIGTPGYPVSAYFSFETFAVPVLSVLTGEKLKQRQKIQAVLSKRVTSSFDRREYIRVKLEKVNDKLTAIPLAKQSGVSMSLVEADGFCIIEQGCESIEAAEIVTVELMY
jgi:putative molybdopterin biosynthesis protein